MLPFYLWKAIRLMGASEFSSAFLLLQLSHKHEAAPISVLTHLEDCRNSDPNNSCKVIELMKEKKNQNFDAVHNQK